MSGMLTSNGGSITPRGASAAGAVGATGTTVIATSAANTDGVSIRFFSSRCNAATRVLLVAGFSVVEAFPGAPVLVRDIDIPPGVQVEVQSVGGSYDFACNYDLK